MLSISSFSRQYSRSFGSGFGAGLFDHEVFGIAANKGTSFSEEEITKTSI